MRLTGIAHIGKDLPPSRPGCGSPTEVPSTSCSLHDLRNLDRRGIPGCAVATDAFRQAADARIKSLGFAADLVWVPHPVQNRTPAELAALADEALPKILAPIERRPD